MKRQVPQFHTGILSQPSKGRRRARKGNTLAEYVGLGAFIVIAAIASLTIFSANFKALVVKVREDMRQHQQAPIAALVARQGGVNGLSQSLSPDQLAILESDMSTKLQTTGANGSTELLAQQLEMAAKKMLAEGKISQDQYDILMKLANQGHKMAQIQGMIDDALRLAGGDFNTFNNMHFTVDGQSYSGQELARLIGFDGPQPSDFQSADILTGATGAGGQVSQFLDLYNQALSSGALSDPTLRATVDSASTQIAGLGETTEDTIWQFSVGQRTLTSGDDLNIAAAQSATTMNSSKICTAGNFTDNGALCTP